MLQPPSRFRLNQKSVQAQGLTAWFPMYHPDNRGNNTHLRDLSVCKNDATDPTYDTITTKSSPVGFMNNFGPNGFIEQAISKFSVVTTGAITYSAWFEIINLPAAGVTNFMVTISDPTYTNFASLSIDESGLARAQFSDGVAQVYPAGTTNLLNTGPHHIMGTRGAGRCRCFIDGQQVANSLDTTGDLGLTNYELYIGGFSSAGLFLPFNNWLADVRVYNGIAHPPAMAQHMFNPATRFDLCLPL